MLWWVLFVSYSLVALPIALFVFQDYSDFPIGHPRRWRMGLILLALHGPFVGFGRDDWRFGVAATIGAVAVWAAARAYDLWEKR